MCGFYWPSNSSNYRMGDGKRKQHWLSERRTWEETAGIDWGRTNQENDDPDVDVCCGWWGPQRYRWEVHVNWRVARMTTNLIVPGMVGGKAKVTRVETKKVTIQRMKLLPCFRYGSILGWEGGFFFCFCGSLHRRDNSRINSYCNQEREYCRCHRV